MGQYYYKEDKCQEEKVLCVVILSPNLVLGTKEDFLGESDMKQSPVPVNGDKCGGQHY
jgi:hypothetical protein